MPSNRRNAIGHSVPRLEDPPLLLGRAAFADDISFDGQLHMRVVRSPEAHGRIIAVDTSAALSMDGVHAVWTAADVEEVAPIEFREGPIPALAPWRQRILASGRVRYVGEPVAAVFAESPYLAEDAAGRCVIELEPLQAIIDASEPPGEFDRGHSTEATVLHQEYGDVAAAFDAIEIEIHLDLKLGRHTAVPIETRGAIGRYDAARDVLELHGAAKVPHRNRDSLAQMLGMSVHQLHLYEAHVGGGFGVRGELYPEDVLVLAAARRLLRPVKWIEDRKEHLSTANHSREQRHTIRVAANRNGQLKGIDNTFFHDQGAYIRTHATRIIEMSCGILPGPYRLPAYRTQGHFRLTNKTPAATYRAPGRYETNFVRERLMDALAHEAGICRVAVRRLNLIAKQDMPYARPLAMLGDDIIYDTGDYAGLLDKALAHFGWQEAECEAQRRRANGELVGLGLAMFVEKSGLGPADGAYVAVDDTGMVEVVTGGASIGQGFETAMAQVCSQVLGVDYRRVRVVHGRTDRIAFGIGAHSSRATVMTGNATAIAAGKVRDKALEVAAELLQIEASRLHIVDGVVRSTAEVGPTISLAEIARQLRPTSRTRRGREPGLSAEGWFETEHMVYPYGVQLGVVRIDPETFAVAFERVLLAYDVGRAINPAMIRGQMIGGFAQGLGGALMEEFRYADNGQPLVTSLADYLMPTSHNVPPIDILLCEDEPTDRNPLGIKGAGECGIAPVGALVASAVDDALQRPGAITELPVTPMKLKRIVDTRGNQSSPHRRKVAPC